MTERLALGLSIVLALGGCLETASVTITPTLPNIYGRVASKRELSSKRIRVTGAPNATPYVRGAVPVTHLAAAVTAAEAELVSDGWEPVVLDDDTEWASDVTSRLIIRSVTSGVDLAHPLDGCRHGPHYYGYCVEVDAALLDMNGSVLWTGRASSRSTDLLELPISATADAWLSGHCEQLIDPGALEPALKAIACDDFTANRCDPSGRSSELVVVAVQRLIRALFGQVKIATTIGRTEGTDE